MIEASKIKKKYKAKVAGFKRQVKINRANLSKDIARNSSYLFSAGLNKSFAEKLRDKAKVNVEVVRAKVREKIEKSKGDKRLTIPQLESRVSSHPEVIQAEMDLVEAKYAFNVCFSAVESLKEKGQQLTNLAYNYRKEMEHGYVKEAKEKRVKDKFKNRK